MKKVVPLNSTLQHDEAIQATLPLFLEHLGVAMIELSRNISERQWDSVEKTAHKAKGSAACYGYPDLVVVTQKLEEEARCHKRIPAALELANEFRELVHRINAAL